MNATRRPLPAGVRFRRSPRILRVFIATLLAGLLLALGWTGAPVAQAEEGENPVKIELTAMTPSTLGPDDSLSVSGTITNVSGAAIGNPQVLLWRSEAPLRTPLELNAAISSEQTSPLGSRVTAPGAYTENLGSEFAAGATARFTVSAPVEVLGLREPGAAYLAGVQMRGVFDGRNQTVGRARTIVPFGQSKPIEVTTVIKLDSPSSLTSGRMFLDDHLEQELAPGGRLAELLQAASQPKASVLIDPALITEVEAMRKTYLVKGADGSFKDSTRANADAAAWLKGLKALKTDRWRLPYANPDLVAIARHSVPELLDSTIKAGEQGEDLNQLPLAVLAPDGQADKGSLKLAKLLEPKAWLLSNAEAAPTFFKSTLAGPTTLVSFDPGYVAGGPGPLPKASAVQIRQRLLSELYLSAQTPGQSRVLVIDTVEAARAVSALDAPGIDRITLTAAIPADPPLFEGAINYAEPPVPLSADHLAEVRRLADTLDTVADLYGDSDDGSHAAEIARVISTSWRGRSEELGGLVAEEIDALQYALNGNGVVLNANPQVVMAGRDGQFPISVTNGLETAVRVQIVFTADNPQRLRIPKIKNIDVPAGQTVSLNAAPHANSNGTYAVRAQLRTTGGEDIGKSKSIIVQANNVGKAGWILVIGAGIILVGGTVLRIRQVRRGESVRHGETGATGSTTEVGQ